MNKLHIPAGRTYPIDSPVLAICECERVVRMAHEMVDGHTFSFNGLEESAKLSLLTADAHLRSNEFALGMSHAVKAILSFHRDRTSDL